MKKNIDKYDSRILCSFPVRAWFDKRGEKSERCARKVAKPGQRCKQHGGAA